MFTYLALSSWRPDLDLRQPIRLRTPRLIRVDHGEGDLFHPAVPDLFIDGVYRIMAQADRHTFLIITKYPSRVMEYSNTRSSLAQYGERPLLPNLWLGVRVMNQADAEERLPYLARIAAPIRFVSCEPLIGAVDLSPWLWEARAVADAHNGGEDTLIEPGMAIQWVIVGGESAPDARPLHPTWARDIRIDCAEAGVKFFFTQWGDYVPAAGRLLPEVVRAEKVGLRPDGTRLGLHDTIKADTAVLIHVGARAAGRSLDGREWNEMPFTT